MSTLPKLWLPFVSALFALACAGVPCVVCYTVRVADQDALRSASYFYEELDACGRDYKKAFDKVNPCDGSFAWFAGANYVETAIVPLVTSVETMRSSLLRTLPNQAAAARRASWHGTLPTCPNVRACSLRWPPSQTSTRAAHVLVIVPTTTRKPRTVSSRTAYWTGRAPLGTSGSAFA